MQVYLLIELNWRKLIIIVSLWTLVACSSQHSIQLQWRIPETGKNYHASVSDPSDKNESIAVNARKLIKSPDLHREIHEKLSSILAKPNQLPLLGKMSRLNSDKIEIKFVSQFKDDKSQSINQDTKLKRTINKKLHGVTLLQANIDSYGDTDYFFLTQAHLNILAMFFKIPDHKIEVGDSWSIPVSLIRLGNGIHADFAEKVNKVSVKSLCYSENAGWTAEIIYTIAEYVEGRMGVLQEEIDNSPPFTYAMSYIARGKFLVDKGYWQSYVGQLTAGDGIDSENDVITKMMLVPTKPVKTISNSRIND